MIIRSGADSMQNRTPKDQQLFKDAIDDGLPADHVEFHYAGTSN